MKYKVTSDSRQITKNSIFVAIKGLTVDGHDYIENAIMNGAVLIVGDNEKKLNKYDFPKIYVNDSRKAFGILASSANNNPSNKLVNIGVTGTDGKTTTVNLIYHILNFVDKKTGMVSTINAKIGNKDIDTGFHVTNPDADVIHDLLSKMVNNKCKYSVLEVTSHGIDQERISGVEFDIAVLTNITHEHLDYHKTFENYRNTKLKLFLDAKISVLNYADPSFVYFKKKLKNKKIITYANKSADYFINDLVMDSNGMNFMVNKKYKFKTNLLGEYNAMNILAACAVSRYLKIPWIKIIKAVNSFPSPDGRLEKIINKKGINAFVDFAHTPNALENVLKLLNQVKREGKLFCVFGCAGERDIEKRPLMGEIATRLSDMVIITAEDPRSEDLNEINRQIISGIKKNNYQVVKDRGEAINKALKLAKKDDIVVICGKGHEKSMNFNGVEKPWSDYRVIKKYIF